MPIRYFSRKKTWGPHPGNATEETLYAYGEPKDPTNKYEEVPFAEMTAYHTPAREQSNFGGDERDLTENDAEVVKATGLSHSYMHANQRALYQDTKTNLSIINSGRKRLENLRNFNPPSVDEGFAETLKSSIKGTKESMRLNGIEYAKGISELRKDAPGELFTHTPEDATIIGAYSHPGMRFTVPTLGAIFLKKHGELTASSDLSAHSSAFVRGALKRGLPVKTSIYNDDASQTNNTQFDYSKEDYVPDWTQRPASNTEPTESRELLDEEVTGAKDYMRKMLFPKKQTPVSADQFGQQNTQPRLPGMSEGPMGSWY